MTAFGDRIDRLGYALTPPLLDDAECDALVVQLGAVGRGGTRRRGGLRNLFERCDAVRDLVRNGVLRAIVEEILSADAFAVRAILFDKTPEANWRVGWHQDVTIAVSKRAEVAGFGPWSVKEGVVCVRPPASVLEHMLTVRLHLDPCGPCNGPLHVLPGSHRFGIGAEPPFPDGPPEMCTVRRGAALLMRPLLWHASGKASKPGNRRVVHIEFADRPLPAPLDWHERW